MGKHIKNKPKQRCTLTGKTITNKEVVLVKEIKNLLEKESVNVIILRVRE